MIVSRLLFVLAASLVILAGCGQKTAQVDGVIVYSDKPGEPATDLEGYLINFEAVDGSGSSIGTVGADGKFTMNTFKDRDGALRGKMKVAVTPPIQLADSSLGPSLIDKRHHAFETSGLEVDIRSGTNHITLTVDRKK